MRATGRITSRAHALFFWVPSYGQNFPAKPRLRITGVVLRTGISFVVIGFALAGSISSAAAQYLPPQPPPAGYPPSAHDPDPASPPPPYQRVQPYPDTDREPYDDADDGPYPAQP